jgi:hypothetical protein
LDSQKLINALHGPLERFPELDPASGSNTGLLGWKTRFRDLVELKHQRLFQRRVAPA